jgi:hypothetical protein
MSIEREIEAIVDTSRKKPREQAVSDIASSIQETKRIPDYFQFILTPNGEFYSTEYRCVVKDIIKKDTELGRAEYEALVKAERIAQEKDAGLIVWISPPYAPYYPTTKVIFYEIVKTDKVSMLSSHAAIFDSLKSFETFNLACLLAGLGDNPIPSDLEDVRKNPIYIAPRNIHWTYLVSRYFLDKQADYYFEMIRSQEDVILKQKAIKVAEELFDQLFNKQDYTPYRLSQQHRQIFGYSSFSCPPLSIAGSGTAFGLMFKIASGEWSGKCPFCGAYNEGLRKGDRCWFCGRIYKGCN